MTAPPCIAGMQRGRDLVLFGLCVSLAAVSGIIAKLMHVAGNGACFTFLSSMG